MAQHEERLPRPAPGPGVTPVAAVRPPAGAGSGPTPASPSLARDPASLLPLLAVILVWSSAFSGIKIALREVTPLELTLLRFAAAALGFVPLFAWRLARRAPGGRARIRGFRRGDWPLLLVMGLFGVPAYHLPLNYGEVGTGAGVAALIIASAPVFTALVAGVALGERTSPRRALGIAIALAGVAVIVLWGRAEGLALRIDRSFTLAALVVLIAPAAWAAYTVAAKPLLARWDPLDLTTVTMGLGTLMLLPFATADLPARAAGLAGPTLGWIAYLGVISSFLAYVVWNRALARHAASQVAVLVYLIPLFAVIIAWLLLDEAVTPFVAVGGALTLAGVVLATRH